MKQQEELIAAAVEARTIKRFLPSEFGFEYETMDTFYPALKDMFQAKMDHRKLLADSGWLLSVISCIVPVLCHSLRLLY